MHFAVVVAAAVAGGPLLQGVEVYVHSRQQQQFREQQHFFKKTRATLHALQQDTKRYLAAAIPAAVAAAATPAAAAILAVAAAVAAAVASTAPDVSPSPPNPKP